MSSSLMEQNMNVVGGNPRKRKASEEQHTFLTFSLDELNQDLLERVLSRLPASSFFRLRSVCRSWNSVANSATFQFACSQIPFRDPWFLMVDQYLDQSIVFDTTEGNWKNISHPVFLQQSRGCKPIPVASSGGLICYHTSSNDLAVCNPITGVRRELPPIGEASESQTLHAIAMYSSQKDDDPTAYKVVMIFGEFSNLAFKVFDSKKNMWGEEVMLVQKGENSTQSDEVGYESTVYFLSKTGDIVATNMQKNPFKQYSSVRLNENGEDVICFLTCSGTIMACNLVEKTFFEYPRLLPAYFEYSIDVVESKGDILVVVLSGFLETASLRVWRFSNEERSWQQVAAMPPSMSHELYKKKVDINCACHRDMIFICVCSDDFSSYVMCNLVTNQWMELPKCYMNGKDKEFISAFCFEPRVEAAV